MILSLVTAAHAGCTLGTLEQSLEAAEHAFITMSDDFDDRRTELESAVGCLKEPVTSTVAARLHRAHGLFAFYDGDASRVQAAFSRYRSLRPGLPLPEELAPEDHPLRRLFAESVPSARTHVLPEPATGSLIIDGLPTRIAPLEMPYVFQQVGNSGTVESTRVLPPGEKPNYALPPPVLAVEEPVPKRGKKMRRWLGVGTAAAGAVAYGSAFVSRNAYEKAVKDGTRQEIQRSHTLTNTLGITGMVVMVGGGALALSGSF